MLPAAADELRGLIRRCLAATHDVRALDGDHVVAGLPPESHARPLRPAAVLVPLIERPTGATILLTRRTEHLAHHAGQISFPGGRVEAGDTDPIDTALREAEEEVGLDRRQVEILGQLDRYQTITEFLVTPVVGVLEPPVQLNPDPHEVAEVFEVPLSFVLDPRNHQRHALWIRGRCRYYYVLPYGEYRIWGATAAMLVGLARTLAGHRP